MASKVNILDLDADEARKFLLSQSSYINFDLPPYFAFSGVLEIASTLLHGKTLKDIADTKSLPTLIGANYHLFSNKDGDFAWRQFTIIHPILYVDLVNKITENVAWSSIKTRFSEYKQSQFIRCSSIPVLRDNRSKSKRAAQVKFWLSKVETASLNMSLKYGTVIQTDIVDCYSSIYTHTIPWALHGKNVAKINKKDTSLIGNQIDKSLQAMNNGQTVSIPQGSALSDLIAEMVLGYVDEQLSNKLTDINVVDYEILRYRDDYRIFVKSELDGKAILKELSEILAGLNLKLNTSKTSLSKNLISSALKDGKYNASDSGDHIFGFDQKQFDLRKSLIAIHRFSGQFPNSGTLVAVLDKFFKKADAVKKPPKIWSSHVETCVAIVTEVASRHPKTNAACVAILSLLFSKVGKTKRIELFELVKARFLELPNSAFHQIWLQRLALPYKFSMTFSEPLAKSVTDESVALWESSWLKNNVGESFVAQNYISESEKLKLKQVMAPEEFSLFDIYD